MKKYLISGFNTVQDVKLEAGTYTLVAYVKSMHGDVYTFALWDGTDWEEFSIDVIQGQLCKVWLTFTIDKKTTKFKPIANNFTEELPVYVTDLQLTRGNIPVEAGASPFDIDQILNDLHDEIDAIEDFTEGAFKDGLLNDVEKTQLKVSLDAIGSIVESVKGSYDKLLDNPFIHENTMNSITARYYAFIASWISDGDPRGLKPVILWIVNGNNIVDQNERDEKDRALNAFNDALYAYNQAEKEVYNDVGENSIAPVIIDGFWAFWNKETGTFIPSEFSAIGDDGHSPYVDVLTGTWWEWNPELGKFKDTFIKAEGKDGITISQNQQGYTYRADLNGDIIGSLANGMVELTITSGSTPITCPSYLSGTPTTNGTYRVTRTLGNDITTNQSLSDGKYRITPATLTVDEASVKLEIKIMMGGVVTSYPLTLTYRKQFDGADGKSTEFIFKGSISDTTAPTLPSTIQQDDWYGQGTTNEWNDDLVEPTKTLPYVWASQRKKVDGVWGAFTPPKVWLRYAEDGDGITSTTIEYAKSSNGTTPPSSGWSTSLPSPTEGWYLWTRTTITYKVATTTVSYSVSHWAKDGDGIVSTTIEYAKSSSGTTIPTSGWGISIPSPTKGMYLWTRTTTVYKTSPTTVAYTTSYWAKDGLPPEIDTTITQYALGESKTDHPAEEGQVWAPSRIIEGQTFPAGYIDIWQDDRKHLVPNEATPYEWSRQRITYKDSTQVMYVGYVLITNISPMTYFFGEWDCRVKYTRSEKSYPIVNHLRGTNNKPLYYYPKKEGVIEYIWFVKPNVNYPSTWYKQKDLVLYKNDGSNGDPVCPLGIFKSKYNDNKDLPSVSSWWDNVTAEYAPNGIEGQKLWEFADGVELIITEALMANYAKLDEFVFNNSKMFSQHGELTEGASEPLKPDYMQKGFIPNFEVDGKTGLMKFGKNIHFGLKNGYAVMEYYDNDGNFLYDLGPSGISKIEVREEKWVEVPLVYLAPTFATALTDYTVRSKMRDDSVQTPTTFYRYVAKIVAGVKEDPNNADGKLFKNDGATIGFIDNGVYMKKVGPQHQEYMTPGTSGTRIYPPGIQDENEFVFDTIPLYAVDMIQYLNGVVIATATAYWNPNLTVG